jgi:hypothetical protein
MQLHASEAPLSPAERANGVLARAVVAQVTKAEPPPPLPLKLPIQATRSAAVLPDLMAEALTPLRLRSSQSLKMKTNQGVPGMIAKKSLNSLNSPPVNFLQKAPLQGSPMHVLNFNMNMDIEL